jgi:hypothetical protein
MEDTVRTRPRPGLPVGFAFGSLLSSDLLILALAVLAFAMLLGAVRRKQAWLPAILLSAGAPLPALLARLHGPYSEPDPLASVVVAGLASSFLGAYAGATARRMLANVFGRPEGL